MLVAQDLRSVVPLEGRGSGVEEVQEPDGPESSSGRQTIGRSLGSIAIDSQSGTFYRCSALLRFLEAISFPVDRESLGAMHETVDEGDHAGGVGEDLVRFTEGLVCCQDEQPFAAENTERRRLRCALRRPPRDTHPSTDARRHEMIQAAILPIELFQHFAHRRTT